MLVYNGENCSTCPRAPVPSLFPLGRALLAHGTMCIPLLAGLDQQQGLELGCDGPGDASGEKPWPGLLPGQAQQPSEHRSTARCGSHPSATKEPWTSAVPSSPQVPALQSCWEQPCCALTLLPSAGWKQGGSISNGAVAFSAAWLCLTGEFAVSLPLARLRGAGCWAVGLPSSRLLPLQMR